MDIPRPSQARKKRIRRIVFGGIGLIALIAITIGLSKLQPAAPSVERATVVIDAVKRGPMLRQVRGTGTLVPEVIRWIPATTDGTVERVLMLAGTPVQPDSILLELSNPEVELAALDAESELHAVEAEHRQLQVRLESDRLTQQAVVASVEAEHHQAVLQSEANEALAKDGLIADITLNLAKVRAEELGTRAGIERQRLAIAADSALAELAAHDTQLDRARARLALRRNLVDKLKVRAGTVGVLQQLPVEVGQRVGPGTNLARVSAPGRLKAEVRIAETQVRDVQIGQVASIDTRNGVVRGHVARIDPASANGTVTVDVAFDEELPRGARPDQSVDGTIELERLDDVVYVGRPAYGQEQSTISLFKLEDGGRGAVRVPVKLGRSSVTTVEVVSGLAPGDQVILSDVSQWDGFDRVRLN